MKALLFALIAVFFIGQSYAQLCGGSIVYNSTSSFCPYPGGKSCCDPAIFDYYQDLYDQAMVGLPKDCTEYIRGVVCSSCDPLSRGDTICKSFCMKFVKGCLSYFGDADLICGDLPDTYCFNGFDFPPLPPREICGVFGDPHVRLFDGSGKTCKSAGSVTYFKSSSLIVGGTNTVVDTTTGATAITSLTITYKGETQTFSVADASYPYFSASDVNSVSLFGGYTYTFLTIDTRISVRIASNEIFFTISSPTKGDTSICKSGCPGQEVNILSFPNGRRVAQAQAEEDCANAGLEKGSFNYKACVYDVSVTGDKNYALSAKEYSDIEADALAEEAYRKKSSSSFENTISVFVILIAALAIILF